jgi:hypothetical protein
LGVVRFGRWTLQCDHVVTGRAYEQVLKGAPERCGCDPCKNFVAQRQSIYPAAVTSLFDQLGIDPSREAEIYHNARMPSGLHLYGGWFHFVGSIEKGGDAFVPVAPNAGSFALEPVGEHFKLGFSAHIGLAPPSFAGRPLVQVEFSAEIPWVISATEPN